MTIVKVQDIVDVFRLQFEQIYCKEENGNLLVCASNLDGSNKKVIAVLPL